jgi:hypothetical protein
MEIKDLSGGVVLYAAQTNTPIDAGIVAKGGYRTDTRIVGFEEPRSLFDQELQESMEHPARLRAHSGLFLANSSLSGCSS